MANDVAESLKQMALHRGFKLVKSRRRKPGTGDFGKFGLTDDKGAELFGFGENGLLTASAEEIEGYLRAGAMSTWKQSAKITPGIQASKVKSASSPDRSGDNEGPRRRGAGQASGRSAPAARDSPKRPAPTPARKASSSVERKVPPATQTAGSKPKLEIVRNEAVLTLRAAKPADAAAIANLLGRLTGVDLDAVTAAKHLAAVKRSGGGTYLADFGELIGCISWAVLQTLQHGAVGRIAVLYVDEGHRRRGIGKRLLAQAETALAKRNCATIEAMSDIDIRNSHNFFRSDDFSQTSYRFARPIAPRGGEAQESTDD